MVDTDRYQAPVNFPFVTLADDGTHVLEKGTPRVQVIPFRRDPIKADLRAETPSEAAERERHHRSTPAAAGAYRKLKGTVP